MKAMMRRLTPASGNDVGKRVAERPGSRQYTKTPPRRKRNPYVKVVLWHDILKVCREQSHVSKCYMMHTAARHGNVRFIISRRWAAAGDESSKKCYLLPAFAGNNAIDRGPANSLNEVMLAMRGER